MNTSTIEPPIGADAEYLAYVAHQTGIGMPAIINSPGDYVTRDGQRVTIFAIADPHMATFNCKGHLYIPNGRGTGWRMKFDIWQPNGRHKALGEHDCDIVGEWDGQK